MPGPNSAISSVDGSIDWSGGADSIKVPTISSQSNPNGLARNQLAWLNNAVVRDGGITPRPGWKKIGPIALSSTNYQGGWMYKPEQGDPYLVVSISGNIMRVNIDPFTVQNLTIQSTVETVPTLPPWTITFKILGNLFNRIPDPNYPVGSLFSDATVGYNGCLGYGFTPFNIPAPDTPVTITLAAPYTGQWLQDLTNVRTITTIDPYLGVIVCTQINGVTTCPPHPPPIYQTTTYGLLFQVLAASPAYMQITVQQPGNTPSIGRAFFRQAERFLIIQAGDYVTLPLFYDGTILRRSKGITDPNIAHPATGVNEIPPAGPMDYYMDRLWYAQQGKYMAGDIVGNTNSGTKAYQYRDSILNVTESPLCFGGDGFSVPRDDGDITALSHNANQDSAMGQGKLFSFTNKGAYSLSVPINRTDWIKTDNSNVPLQVPIQLANGTSGDRSVVPVNGDLFYQSLEPHIRSIITAMRFFNQWSNVPISAPMNRILQFTDRNLLGWATGILFDNRLIESQLPIATPQGIVHQGLIILDFEPLSTFETGLSPVWNAMWQGLDILQLFTGIFDGQERAFAVAVSRIDQTIELWEMTKDDRFDNQGLPNGDNRIQMQIEFPAFEWGQVFALKKVVSAEMWIDRLYGEAVFLLEYRPDGEACWTKWHEWKVCTARTSCENTNVDPCTGLTQVQCYPATELGESYRQTLTLPKPPLNCAKTMGRPSNICYQMQCRLTVTGFVRIRGFLIHAEGVEQKLYHDMAPC